MNFSITLIVKVYNLKKSFVEHFYETEKVLSTNHWSTIIEIGYGSGFLVNLDGSGSRTRFFYDSKREKISFEKNFKLLYKNCYKRYFMGLHEGISAIQTMKSFYFYFLFYCVSLLSQTLVVWFESRTTSSTLQKICKYIRAEYSKCPYRLHNLILQCTENVERMKSW